MKKIILLTIVIHLFFVKASTSQNQKTDSLLRLINASKTDSNKVKLLNKLSETLWRGGETKIAVIHAKNALKIAKKIRFKKGEAIALGHLGIVEFLIGKYPEALGYQLRALKIGEEISDKKGISSIYNNIGIIYENQNDFEMAFIYYGKSLKIDKEINDKKGMASSYNNIGNMSFFKGDYPKALKYYFNSLALFETLGEKSGIANSSGNIANIYGNQKKFEKALTYYLNALKIMKELGDNWAISNSYYNISCTYLNLNKIKEAKSYGNMALELALKIDSKEEIKLSYHVLSEIDSINGNYKAAFLHYKSFVKYRDKVFNEENTKKTLEQQIKFNFDKKATADSVLNAKSQEIKDIEIAKQQAELRAKHNQQYALFGGLILTVIFGIFMFNRFRITTKQKKIIEGQKQIVEKQKLLVEEKQKEVLDSIRYAKRIQEALLPSTGYISRVLKNLNK